MSSPCSHLSNSGSASSSPGTTNKSRRLCSHSSSSFFSLDISLTVSFISVSLLLLNCFLLVIYARTHHVIMYTFFTVTRIHILKQRFLQLRQHSESLLHLRFGYPSSVLIANPPHVSFYPNPLFATNRIHIIRAHVHSASI